MQAALKAAELTRGGRDEEIFAIQQEVEVLIPFSLATLY